MKTKYAKICISIESDEALERITKIVNDGFTGGRISKSLVASWIITYFEGNSMETNLEKIRRDHFDQITYLESVVREMKSSKKNGIGLPDLNSLLIPIVGSAKSQKKRPTLEGDDGLNSVLRDGSPLSKVVQENNKINA